MLRGQKGTRLFWMKPVASVAAINLVLYAILVILKTIMPLGTRHAPYHHDDSPPERRPQ